MSHALLAIQNILQNSNIFIGSRETVLFTPFGSKKVTQFSGLLPTSVSYLKHRINAGDKADALSLDNASDETVASIFDSKLCIPLDFEILESSIPLYQYGLVSR